MPDVILFIIGLVVTVIVLVAMLMIARQDAADRRAHGERINGPIDRALLGRETRGDQPSRLRSF